MLWLMHHRRPGNRLVKRVVAKRVAVQRVGLFPIIRVRVRVMVMVRVSLGLGFCAAKVSQCLMVGCESMVRRKGRRVAHACMSE